jgi:hypothetical protein
MGKRAKKQEATIPEMPVSAETPTAEVVKVTMASEREALTFTERLVKAYRSFTAAWWQMGQMVKEALDREVPAALGKNAHEWMIEVFGETASVAKIQRSLRIARALEKLPPESVRQLTEGKAYLLTQLKEKDREEFLGAAITVTNKEFEQMVETKREEYGITPAEREVFITLRLPESAAGAFERAIQKFARLFELDIDLKPGLRVEVVERLANFINEIPDERLVIEAEGGE